MRPRPQLGAPSAAREAAHAPAPSAITRGQHQRRHHADVDDPLRESRSASCRSRDFQALMPPSVVRQASSAIARPSSSAPKRSSRVGRARARLGGEEVDDDVAALELAPRHEQRDRRAGGGARQLEVADDRRADEVAADQADAGHQRHDGQQHAGERWRTAWRAISSSRKASAFVDVFGASATRSIAAASDSVLRVGQARPSVRRGSSSSAIWQLSRLVGWRGAAVISSIASSSADGAGRRSTHAGSTIDVAGRAGHACRRSRPDAVDAGVDARRASGSGRRRRSTRVGAAVGLDEVDGDRRGAIAHGDLRSG